jgi:hypothetical protein
MPTRNAQEEAMAGYKTIILELLQDQYPATYDRLRRRRALPATLDRLALELNKAHTAWMSELRRADPNRSIEQIASEALELAIEHLQGSLPSESPPDDAAETFSLDAAMAALIAIVEEHLRL